MERSSEAKLKRIHCIRVVSAGHLGPGSLSGVRRSDACCKGVSRSKGTTGRNVYLLQLV